MSQRPLPGRVCWDMNRPDRQPRTALLLLPIVLILGNISPARAVPGEPVTTEPDLSSVAQRALDHLTKDLETRRKRKPDCDPWSQRHVLDGWFTDAEIAQVRVELTAAGLVTEPPLYRGTWLVKETP